MIGHYGPVEFDCKHINHRKGGRENRDHSGVAHRPNSPLTLLSTWPTRKLYQTTKQSSDVTAIRAPDNLGSSGVRQTSQYSGSIPSPIATNCSFNSNVPLIVNSRALSRKGRTAKR